MKKICLILVIALSMFSLVVQGQLSGNAFLSGQTNHSGIKIKFAANSGTAVSDSVYTNAAGNYTANITGGVYTIIISKTGYLTENYNNGASLLLTNTVVLNSTTLLPGNQIFVSGNVSGNWTNNNVYIVNGNITVPSGSQLTIQPGTTIKFNGNYSLIANGTLSAVGTSANKIVFTSNLNPQTIGDWNRIEPNNSSCILDHCIVEYAMTGLYFSAFSPTISNSTFREIGSVGIYCNNCQPKISYNEVYDIIAPSGAIGIWVENNGCCGIIECNHIYNCISSGYHAYGMITGANVIRNNSIHHISGSGLSIGIEVRGNSRIENNYINNCVDGIETDNTFAAASPTVSNNTLRLNTKGITTNMSMVIVNNIISDNIYGIVSSGSAVPTISHNLLWNNSNANYMGVPLAGIGQTVSTNAQGNPIDSYFNMAQDPLYASGYAPVLTVSSPCFNAGDPAYSVNIGFNTNHSCAASVPTALTHLIKEASLLDLYPNPTSGQFILQTDLKNDIESIHLFDISGKEVPFRKMDETNFDVSGLENGIYFLTIKNISGSATKKLVIAR